MLFFKWKCLNLYEHWFLSFVLNVREGLNRQKAYSRFKPGLHHLLQRPSSSSTGLVEMNEWGYWIVFFNAGPLLVWTPSMRACGRACVCEYVKAQGNVGWLAGWQRDGYLSAPLSVLNVIFALAVLVRSVCRARCSLCGDQWDPQNSQHREEVTQPDLTQLSQVCWPSLIPLRTQQFGPDGTRLSAVVCHCIRPDIVPLCYSASTLFKVWCCAIVLLYAHDRELYWWCWNGYNINSLYLCDIQIFQSVFQQNLNVSPSMIMDKLSNNQLSGVLSKLTVCTLR